MQATQQSLDKATENFTDQAMALEALRAAMRATVPPMMADHVEGAASEGHSLVTDVTTEPAAALYITLHGFDGWALTADAQSVKRRLDHFCTAVALRARANGGHVQQVLGHAHLLVFGADAASVRSAVRCALEIAAIVPQESPAASSVSGIGAASPVGVVSALHVGLSSSGFFGEGDSATLVETGEALLVARGVSALAHEPVFYATSAVQQLVTGDPAFALALLGPAAIFGGPQVMLYRVTATDESIGAGPTNPGTQSFSNASEPPHDGGRPARPQPGASREGRAVVDNRDDDKGGGGDA
jgi:class 3 adenylate cyclase